MSQHADLPRQVRSSVDVPTDLATLNVIARLCKANQAKEALDTAVADIQRALGVQSENSTKSRRLRAKDFEETASKTTVAHSDHQDPSHDSSGETPAYQGFDASNDAFFGSEDDFAALDDRIAASSEDEVEVEDGDNQLEGGGVSRQSGYNPKVDMSLSGSDDDPQSASPEPQKAPTSTKSSFLPSLTMGGFISGSGSDLDDDIDVAPKKNRRGQRARQQIWEKKFGTKAKHLQRQDRNKGWDRKRGAVDVGKGHSKESKGRGVRGSSDCNVGTTGPGKTKPISAGENKTKSRDDSGSIHPSWEAAKKAKERRDAPVAFQGKKITFD